MMFEYIKDLVQGKELPWMGQNEDGEFVIIECGACESCICFKVTTVQDNDWLRINHYYEDGTVEETYRK